MGNQRPYRRAQQRGISIRIVYSLFRVDVIDFVTKAFHIRVHGTELSIPARKSLLPLRWCMERETGHSFVHREDAGEKDLLAGTKAYHYHPS